MKLYQLTYLISPALNFEEAKDFSQKIDSSISENGKIIKPSSPNRKTLAYPIKKESTAYLTYLEFYLDPQKIEDLKEKTKKENKILRFLIVEKKVPKNKNKFVSRRTKIKTPLREGKEPIQKKAELKKIEEKLEEILKE